MKIFIILAKYKKVHYLPKRRINKLLQGENWIPRAWTEARN